MSDKAALKEARSDVLDAFARLERGVTAALGAAASEFAPGAPLSQRVAKLKSNARFKEPASAIERLVQTRNDIVHSEVKFATISGKVGCCALYTNANCPDKYPPLRLLDAADHRALCEEVLRLAISLLRATAPTPPASRPPSPPAAVDS